MATQASGRGTPGATAPGTAPERLDPEECWELLAEHRVGRLAYRLVDEVHVVPLDYAVEGHSLYLRTHAGNKLLAAELSADVALEIDRYDDDHSWSVLVRGRLRRITEPEREPSLDFPDRPWFPQEGSEVVELVAESVDGRRFAMQEE
jgi:hypothetical protein